MEHKSCGILFSENIVTTTNFFRLGKDHWGKRYYLMQPLSNKTIKEIRRCVLMGIGLRVLTKYL